jgi:putative RecB family exonuclease
VEAEPVALPAEWHGTVLVVPDDDLRGTVLRRSALSVSTAQNISGCQARFALEKLYQHTGQVPPDDLFAPNVIGNLAHEVLETLYRAAPDDRSEQLAEDISTEVVAQAIRRNHLAAQVSFTELLLAEVRDAYRGVFRLEDPSGVHVARVPVNGEEVPGLELQLSGVHIAGGVPLIGFVDRARAIGGDDSRISIEDYKSGNGKRKREKDRYFSYGDQLRIYALGFRALTGIAAEEARVIYSRHSRSRILDAPVTLAPTALDKTAGWFAGAWEAHLGLADTGLYETSDGPLCGWCPFVRICPTARENGREAKAGQPEGILADLPALPRVIAAGDGPAEPGTPRTTSQDDQEESIMSSTSRLFGKELKVWEDAPDGALPNPNGYAAIGAFGLVGLAVEELHKAGVPLSPSKVTALSETFAVVVCHVQKETAGSTDLAAGANTRMRGALRTALETLPVPFEQDAEAWDAWAEGLARRTKSIAVVAAHLMGGSFGDKPWRALAADTRSRVKAA